MPDEESSPFRQRLSDVLAAIERQMEDPSYRKKLERVRRRRKARADRWEGAFWQHLEHPNFAVYDDVYARQYGFVCRCHRGRLKYWPVSLSALLYVSLRARSVREQAPRVHVLPPAWVRAMGNGGPRPTREVRTSAERAATRAKALLHQFLSREQRWALRAGGTFRTRGQDGQIYEVGGLGGVRRIVDGRVQTSFCIHPVSDLPTYDVLLAQKLLLETNIDHFLATANIHPVADQAMAAGT